MSYLYLIGLPFGVSTRTRTRPDSGSSGARRKRASPLAAAARIAFLSSFSRRNVFFEATGRLGLSTAREGLSGQEQGQGPRRLGGGTVEFDAHESALLDLDRGARPSRQQVPEELAQVRHVADEKGAGELAPLDLLEDLLRIGPGRERLRLDRLLAGLDLFRDRRGGLA